MHPAFSVIFLTTLIGAGQGLFLALYTVESYHAVGVLPRADVVFYISGSLLTVALLIGGLIASFFHLGHPERAWRAAARWRTSWLSREVIILPMAIGATLVYGFVHFMDWDISLIGLEPLFPGDLSLAVGAVGVVIMFALYVCTGMIYACIKFLQEWASPLTVINYTLLGIASGFTLATALAAFQAPALTGFLGGWAMIAIAAGLVTRSWSLLRNRRIKPRSSIQTAIGVRHTRIRQESQGFLGGSFNTREFFHGAPAWLFRAVKWLFLLLAFVLPLALLGSGLADASPALLVAAFAVQYLGLLAERWFFFAQANHPQNLYYQLVS